MTESETINEAELKKRIGVNEIKLLHETDLEKGKKYYLQKNDDKYKYLGTLNEYDTDVEPHDHYEFVVKIKFSKDPNHKPNGFRREYVEVPTSECFGIGCIVSGGKKRRRKSRKNKSSRRRRTNRRKTNIMQLLY
jgi:hypothetical protein